MIDHVLTFIKQEQEETRYKIYLTDALKIISENTAKFAGGMYLTQRWYQSEHVEQQSGDDIAKDIIKRAGLTVGG